MLTIMIIFYSSTGPDIYQDRGMKNRKKRVSSGIVGLDRMLNGLFIGDNVVWYDDAGNLAADFSMKFIRQSQKQNRSIIYVSFDRSPRNLIEKLGPLAENQDLIILDCFTNGKGDKSEIFNKFYEKDGAQWPYKVIKVTRPESSQAVSETILGLHKTLAHDVRFVFESLTGMADLWGGEDHISKFYSHTCPQLYELDTIAYWMIEKDAHSAKLKAHINQIAQVVVDLSMKQGKKRIKVLKAENRSPATLGKIFDYKDTGGDILIEGEKPRAIQADIGSVVKHYRKLQGMSQKELSGLVGVTSSNISQIESNLIFPSIPALYKLAEHLSVDVGSFFQEKNTLEKIIYKAVDGVKINLATLDKKNLDIFQLTPFDMKGKADLFRVAIFPGKKLSSHFFPFKGEEAGHLLSGKIDMVYKDQTYSLEPGDTVYLNTFSPSMWQNRGEEAAILLWIKIK
jgi:transcriptional regulator with XRE-family HTH domain